MKQIVFVLLLFATQAGAQSLLPKFELKATAGRAADDEAGQTVMGASVRYAITDRLGIEPEFLYGWENEGFASTLTVIPHASFNFRKNSKARPYLIAGVGWLHYSGTAAPLSSSIPYKFKFSGDEVTWNAGFGLKVSVTPKVFFVLPDFRVGRQPTVRLTASIGFAF